MGGKPTFPPSTLFIDLGDCIWIIGLERRKNVNRGYRKLRTWQMAIELYAFLCEKVKEIPGSPYRLVAQILDAGSPISANIAEGYCRRSLKEYLYFLNVASASAGEVYSRCYACYRAGQFSEATFDAIDERHYAMETPCFVKSNHFRQNSRRANGMITFFSVRTNSSTF